MNFNNSIFLITGGTGSFGQAFTKYLLKHVNIKEVRILSRDEKKQEDMRFAFNSDKLKFFIGDVRDKNSLERAFDGVNYVFHAAALKQVPTCEFFPMEALKTNVLGTNNVLDAAIKFKVFKTIVLSTDKAVYPINAMGLSKAMMERIMIAKSRLVDKAIFAGTRYGNVMCSRGSVIPLFVNQIINNQPISITNERMTRFLMSLEDSILLVMRAFKYAKPGDIFVKKAPASTIGTLALALLNIFESKVPIHKIGVRHGEKIHETLISVEEFQRTVVTDNYFRISVDDRDLNYVSNYAKYVLKGSVTSATFRDGYTSNNTKQLDEKSLIELLLGLDYIKRMLKDRYRCIR